MKLPKKQNLLLLLFFLVVAVYFIFLQWSPNFPDPDSFYHIKMSVLMQKNLIFKTFPWIQFADFTNKFTDHQFLYHLILIPFTYFLPPLLGGKIATVIFATAAIIAFYLFLKKWQIHSPLFYTLILLSSAPFIFRINLAKTTALSFIMLLFAVNFLWRKKYLMLFLISFFYVWFYGGWSLLLILLFSQIISELIIKKRFPWQEVTIIASGLSMGLIFNPYFPNNLLFYWQQMIQIGLINYQDQIQVGMEWYPYPPLELLANNIFIFLLGILTFVLLFFKIKRDEKTVIKNTDAKFIRIFTLFIFSGILLILTLKSQRFIEYFVPLAILSSAFFINILLPENFSFQKEIIKNFRTDKKLNAALIIYLCTVFVFFFILNSLQTQQQMSARYNWAYLKNTSLWLKNNTPENSLVFNINWGDWPILFYNNTHNIYINGLDPTFFYLKNKNLYKEWIEIGQGKIKENLASKIKNDFNSRWVLVKNSETEFLSAIRANSEFELRFADNEAKIYEIK